MHRKWHTQNKQRTDVSVWRLLSPSSFGHIHMHIRVCIQRVCTHIHGMHKYKHALAYAMHACMYEHMYMNARMHVCIYPCVHLYVAEIFFHAYAYICMDLNQCMHMWCAFRTHERRAIQNHEHTHEHICRYLKTSSMRLHGSIRTMTRPSLC